MTYSSLARLCIHAMHSMNFMPDWPYLARYETLQTCEEQPPHSCEQDSKLSEQGMCCAESELGLQVPPCMLPSWHVELTGAAAMVFACGLQQQ
jgi:hypothetical protein